jgi:hypothetical protein
MEENTMIKKIVKAFFKVLGAVIGLLLLIILGYVLYNTPFKAKYRSLTENELKVYTDYLDTTISEPLQFVSDKFRAYDIVLIGETHRWKQQVVFVKQLIPFLYERNHVTVVGWEFGPSNFQAQADSLVSAREFDERAAIHLMRLSNWGWNYQEYLDICRTVWQVNRTIPSREEKIRFLQLGSDLNERKLESPDPKVRMQERIRFPYDKKMADIMEREVIQKGKKGLWYSGLHHAFTKFRQPMYFFRVQRGTDQRGGNYLYKKYPNRLYMIALHPPVPSRWVLLAELTHSEWQLYLPFGGVLDALYEKRKKAFAFDNGRSPFGNLEDNYSYYSLDRWGSLKLKEFCDGYVVVSSFQEAEPVARIDQWIASEAELKEVKERMTPETANRIQTAQDLVNMLEHDRVWVANSLRKVRRTAD